MNDTPFIPITKYVTLGCTDLYELDEAVNKAIAQGWQPFGGVSIGFTNDNKRYYVQAMVKYGGIEMEKIENNG